MKAKDIYAEIGMGVDQAPVGNKAQIVTGRLAESGICGGLIEAYCDYPWVEIDDDSTEKALREEVDPTARKTFINPRNVVEADDGEDFDSDMTSYQVCEIHLDNGRIVYLAEFWENIARKLDMHGVMMEMEL